MWLPIALTKDERSEAIQAWTEFTSGACPFYYDNANTPHCLWCGVFHLAKEVNSSDGFTRFNVGIDWEDMESFHSLSKAARRLTKMYLEHTRQEAERNNS